MKSKILVLQGIPASGKTTFARKFIEENPGWIRVNRDDIRRMFGKYWEPSRENLVEEAEYAIVEEALLGGGWNVIVDDTNLNKFYIDTWIDCAEMNDADIEFKKFEVSLEEAIERDKNRENPVGEDVIKRFYNKYYGNI